MKLNKKQIALPVIIIVAVLILNVILWWVWSTKDDAISEDQAFNLIKQCEAEGTYSLHSGEVGLLLKTTDPQAAESHSNLLQVKNTTVDNLRQHQNPTCPFTTWLIE